MLTSQFITFAINGTPNVGQVTVDTVRLADRWSAATYLVDQNMDGPYLLCALHRLTNIFSGCMSVRVVCAWVLLHKPIHTAKSWYFLHCFWSPFKEMNANWNYLLEIITFTYNSCTNYDFESWENIFGKNYYTMLTAGSHVDKRWASSNKNWSSEICVQYSTVPVYVSWDK